MEPLTYSGSSANIAYYGEPGPARKGRIWCDVLRSFPLKRAPDGALEHDRSRPITFHITVYRERVGEVAKTTVERVRSRAPARLSDRTVTQIVRELIEGKEG